MNMKLLHTPDGVRDIYNGECERKLELERRLRSVLFSYGCRPIETPTFEFFDVFGSSVGTTPSRDLYKFLDRDGSTLVFVAVKYRSGSRTGTGAEAVDKKKQERIARCAGYYLFRHPGLRKLPCRFDVISVDGHRITHYMDAFCR